MCVDVPWRTAFPTVLPGVSVVEVGHAECGSISVVCEELQWWQYVPRAGERNAMVWYDRASGEPTMVRESMGPATAVGDGTVRIGVDEWTREPGTSSVSHERIVIVGVVGREGARWRSMTMDDHTTRVGDSEFEANWAGGGGVRVVDNGRYETIGVRRFRTTTMDGIGSGVVQLTVGHRLFVCLRALDLPMTGRPEEIAQSLIDLQTGRTLAYWQYRPTEWDDDADQWLADHPGVEVAIDDRIYQRRNCSGRDEITLTAAALGVEVGPG